MGLGTGGDGHASLDFCGFLLVFVSGGSWCLRGRGEPKPLGELVSCVDVAVSSGAWKFPYPAAHHTCEGKKRMD